MTSHLPTISELLGGATLQTESHRSLNLGDAIRDGRIDLAIIRQNAVTVGNPSVLIMKMAFHLCIPRTLLKQNLTDREAAKPALWQTLPFAAGRDGGQTDTAVRAAMRDAGVDFRPRYECGSMLQVRQLVESGACAAVLPSLGLRGLDEKQTLIIPFTPLKDYGRSLVLHWNPRQMRRRGVEEATLRKIARLMGRPSSPLA